MSVFGDYGVRVLLSVQGVQDWGVTLHDRPLDDGGPYVQVRTGSVLTYVYSAEAAHAAKLAWEAALLKTRIAFASRVTGLIDPLAQASVQLPLRGCPSWDVTGYTTHSAPDRVACIWVRVGPLTIRALDTAAVRSLRAAWTRADILTTAAFDTADWIVTRRCKAARKLSNVVE